jgi:hypothetical protein
MKCQCQLCLGCTSQGEKNFVEPRMCDKFVEDRTNREKEYIQEQLHEYKNGQNRRS